jgi:hypothetical protein
VLLRLPLLVACNSFLSAHTPHETREKCIPIQRLLDCVQNSRHSRTYFEIRLLGASKWCDRNRYTFKKQSITRDHAKAPLLSEKSICTLVFATERTVQRPQPKNQKPKCNTQYKKRLRSSRRGPQDPNTRNPIRSAEASCTLISAGSVDPMPAYEHH